MKILFFIENLRSGGKERRLLELIFYLKKDTSYKIALVVMDDWIDYPYVNDLNIELVILKRKYFKKDPLVFFKLYKIVKKFKPDIIHTWGATATFYSIPSSLFTRVKLVANIISNAKRNFSNISFDSFVYKLGFIFSDKILSNSYAGLKEYGVNENVKSQVIYNGVRMERFDVSLNKALIREDLGVGAGRMILMVASTAKNKDYDLLIDVAKLCEGVTPKLSFFCVGRGNDLERLKSRLDNEKVNNVYFLGGRSDVEHLIYASDLCVLFTNNKIHGEGISNAVIEYMASYKPIISTDSIGGTREIISNGENGFILPRDPIVVVEKILEILNDSNEMDRLGKAARNTVDTKFSIDVMGEEFTKLYTNILSR